MASATNLKPAQTTLGDAAEVYGTRPNITLPGADQTDPAEEAVETAAAARATDRARVSGTDRTGSLVSAIEPFAPDAADYTVVGSERSAP